ncbi:metallophosphoesterase [Paenibacillus bovis]|uniref:Serine/threonine protein phosphatase n=1 Tax=Paenibacillus bovis TaxID=1616788 RepID=A0A172ZKL6_9BACL|nr:metallophosphoesterase [Paenibacillus bovis]ANF98181.1 serine/threonine protein phosphatase [Paenibacillus bovis]
MSGRTLAISDIHGELDLLDRLLDKIDYRPEQDQLILLGDYVDRGSNSRGTLERVIQLTRAGAIALKGNHEDLMFNALTSSREADWNRWLKVNGGLATLLSYGFTREELITLSGEDFHLPDLHNEELQQHLEFIRELPLYYETPDYLYVHAGVEPGKTAAETTARQLFWIREPFHTGYDGEQLVVFGHTPTFYLHQNAANFDIFYGVNRIIGIDGGAAYGGQLNALDTTSGISYAVHKQ